MTIHLFVNPASGPEQDIDWAGLLEDAGVEVTSTFRSIDELRASPPNADDRVLVAGGDGTIHQVARLAVENDWVLGVLPSGTANDLARALEIPQTPREACRVVAAGRIRPIDVGWVNDDVLLNAAQLGLGPEVSSAADRSHKSRWGRFSYLRGLFERLLERLKGQRGFRAGIVVGDDRAGGRWVNVTVANGPYFGGGHAVHQHARIDDGLLDVVALRARPAYQLAWAWLMRRLGIGYPEAVRHWRGATVRIVTSDEHSVTLDGDPCTRTPLQASVRPEALRVFAPRVEKRSGW
jgi:YegS/Rv2252/BmrU family lipid kinase